MALQRNYKVEWETCELDDNGELIGLEFTEAYFEDGEEATLWFMKKKSESNVHHARLLKNDKE